MKLIDNIHTTLAEDLRTTLTSGTRLSLAASCFSIYTYQKRALSKQMLLADQIKKLKALLTARG
jgi:hypothetical protein